MVVVLLFLTISLSNETKKIKAQHTDANRVNDDNSNRFTENLARLADGLANISIKVERVESDLAYHSNMVAGDIANISTKIDSVAGDLVIISSRIERVEVNLEEITVSYLENRFLCII